MFIATIFSAIDAALDSLMKGFSISQSGGLAVPMFLIDWLINLFAVVLAVVSLFRFLPVLAVMLQGSAQELTSE